MSEKEHLCTLSKFGNDLQPGRRTRIVAVDQDVIEDDRARGHSLNMVFDGCQSQREIHLIASAIAQAADFHLLHALSNRHQHRLIAFAKSCSESNMIAERETGKQLACALQDRALMFLAIRA